MDGDLFGKIVLGIVVAVYLLLGFIGVFNNEITKDKSIPKKLAIGAGAAIGGLWSTAIFLIIVAVVIAFFLSGGAEPAP